MVSELLGSEKVKPTVISKFLSFKLGYWGLVLESCLCLPHFCLTAHQCTVRYVNPTVFLFLTLGNYRMCQFLLEKYGYVGLRDSFNCTPLDIARNRGHMEICELIKSTIRKSEETENHGKRRRTS